MGERGSGKNSSCKYVLSKPVVSEDGNVELSLYNEITHRFPTNEANLERSRPSLQSHQISPRCFDSTDQTEMEAQTVCVTKQKLTHGDGSFFFFFQKSADREPKTTAAA